MFPYFLLFALPAFGATAHSSVPAKFTRPRSTDERWPNAWRWMLVLLTAMIGLRNEVGGDWWNYEDMLKFLAGSTFGEALQYGDPAYSALNWLIAYIGGDIHLVNVICAAVFAYGLITFCLAQPRPWLALTVAIPYLVIVVAMGYTRQAVAIGLGMLALTAMSRQQMLRFVVYVAVAASFHKSAVILMPLAMLGATRSRLWTAMWVGFASFLFYVLLLQDSVDYFRTNYLEAQYESSGATIRVAMNVVPAFLFLALRGRFAMPDADRTFWTWASLGAVALVIALWLNPASAAVDRIALYCIPLQLFVLSRVPDALGGPYSSRLQTTLAVVGYSAAVMVIWLQFAEHSKYWLPYRFFALGLVS